MTGNLCQKHIMSGIGTGSAESHNVDLRQFLKIVIRIKSLHDIQLNETKIDSYNIVTDRQE